MRVPDSAATQQTATMSVGNRSPRKATLKRWVALAALTALPAAIGVQPVAGEKTPGTWPTHDRYEPSVPCALPAASRAAPRRDVLVIAGDGARALLDTAVPWAVASPPGQSDWWGLTCRHQHTTVLASEVTRPPDTHP